ncbi:uncharacterized protein LOC134316922 [Trichomycterus rosablanca]|uniref:uncharacterized protein LOC134316922 n=1 Tax=Trichomycterus rosablanca TaxID=2290929 RepID=UPI002F35CBB7
MAGYHTARVEEDEEDEDEGGPVLYIAGLQERRRRREQIDQIQRFLSAAAEREADLLSLLHWLSETEESLQDCVSKKQACKEWAEDMEENMEEKLDKLLVDVNCAINRLCTICQYLFDIESKKRKIQTAQKTGVLRCLKEQKVDPKMMKRIQKLQPPTADKFLADASLASKSSTELTLMLNDIAKSMSSNKATDMAFRYFQMGLQNLNQAFQERTTEVKSLQVQIEEMKRNDCQFEMAQLKMEITDSNMRISELQKELVQIKEHNAALMLQNEAITVPYQKEEEKYKLAKGRLKLKFPKQKKKVQEQQNIEHSFIHSLSVLKPCYPDEDQDGSNSLGERQETLQTGDQSISGQNIDVQHYRQEQSAQKEEPIDFAEESPHHSVIPMSLKISEEPVPRKSSDPAQTFKGPLLDLTNIHMEMLPENKDQLTELVSDVYMELPSDEKPESELLQSVKHSPSDMLSIVNEEIEKYELAVRDAGHQLQAVSTEDAESDSWQNSLAILLNQFKNINEIGKKQVWNMQLVLKLLQEIHSNMTQKDKPLAQEELISQDPFPVPIPFCGHSPVLSPSMMMYPNKEILKVVREQMQPNGAIKIHKPEQIVNTKPAESVVIMDCVERYVKDIKVEGERLLQTKMKGRTHVINVKCQRTNLRLLNQAYVNRNISPRLFYLARDVVLDTLASVNMRIACLFQRYITHIALQQLRKTLDAQLQQARELNSGKAVKDLHFFLQRLSEFQHKVISKWTDKQISIDQRRLKCMAQMTYLFHQMKVDYRLQLAPPYTCQRGLSQPLLSVTPWKMHWSLNLDLMQNLQPVSGGPCHAPPNSPSLHPHCCNTSRKSGLVTGNLWQAKDTKNSMWLASQVPVDSARDSSTVPLLLEMDINHERISATRNLMTRVYGTPDYHPLDKDK